MNLFLDCEFNGFGGSLISMALVDENQHYFYEVLACESPIPWVETHVMPQLNQPVIEWEQFQWKLRHFLQGYQHVHIIADWPEDLSLFLNALIVHPGNHMAVPALTMALWKPTQNDHFIDAKQPHNALSDAIALQKNYQSMNK